jgi:hypothetical protein
MAYEETVGSGMVRTYDFSKVNSPNNLFDIFGRFIVDIVILGKTAEQNINQWLVEEGWAIPLFYDSMSNKEIITLRDLSRKAKDKSKGSWEKYSDMLLPFNFDLLFPGRGYEIIDIFSDAGEFNMPKIFRRIQENKQLLESNKQLKIEDSKLRDFIKVAASKLETQIQLILGV